ncbi:MAG: M1 family metallopeptidase [Bacteroidetes bacterium]|nr:M1 family metallopeptidase [Bacteroidota bacterium]
MHKYILSFFILFVAFSNLPFASNAQLLKGKTNYTHQDTLRGSIGPGRDWWDVLQYNISTEPDYVAKSIKGSVQIVFGITKPGANKIMQIDLQEPLMIDSIIFFNKNITSLKRDGNAYFVDFGDYTFGKTPSNTNEMNHKALQYSIMIYYHGKPRVASYPPWDGGWIFTKDAEGRPWMTVACQGLGASVWYPCKDHQSDEPDLGASLSITAIDSLTAVGNGRLIEKRNNQNGTTTWLWEVKNPINNYDIIPYIGKYVNFTDTLMGEKGKLDISYWVMDYNLEKAKKQFGRDVKAMLRAFEYWFGPYPFYEDSYKLVESSHLGMEHQSAVAYGNKYLNGYLGRDLSGTGWGLKWDYIIIHESGHEWFGNNITTKDIADMWVHEGFTMYSEALFTEYYYGKKAADEYLIGLRKSISNSTPLIGPYGVNKEGSGDMYNKGANMIHTIRQIINDDNLFRNILRGLNSTFYHQTVTTQEIENYISTQSRKDLSKIFDQFLRTTKIPVFEYKLKGKTLEYRWTNCINGFNMPLKISVKGTERWVTPTENWQTIKLGKGITPATFSINKNFYVDSKKVD